MDTYHYRPQRPVISMVWSPQLQLGKQALLIHTRRAKDPLLVIGQRQRGLDAMKQTSLFCSRTETRVTGPMQVTHGRAETTGQVGLGIRSLTLSVASLTL